MHHASPSTPRGRSFTTPVSRRPSINTGNRASLFRGSTNGRPTATPSRWSHISVLDGGVARPYARRLRRGSPLFRLTLTTTRFWVLARPCLNDGSSLLPQWDRCCRLPPYTGSTPPPCVLRQHPRCDAGGHNDFVWVSLLLQSCALGVPSSLVQRVRREPAPGVAISQPIFTFGHMGNQISGKSSRLSRNLCQGGT